MGKFKEMTVIASKGALYYFLEGESVYISEQYYKDVESDFVEIPRFGWVVKSILNDVATIEFQRKTINLNMTLMIDTKYLSKEW